ncbi:hypothetical protein [Mesorhizobium sp. M1E.F.Ca.ET.063.01.1.1]|uniref:hypothetical protein n=1 Tax=Mesorhizobium sp. M1E.F.Ca.ET.063.01.1.1 TaxID=2496750 RepID=UPI000FCBAEB3|nr:hypothetical protein [Mesorhizobium sp. M1E.F.Ca.ET.063.01.1.1]RUW85305.1 hypothetical protein EOA29_05415 [Mesorhizobium sp. M1E.F.Ca.ET.063.01.1.1]
MTKVAAEYGVTGTALKKTCDRHKIPTPERGYWAKLQHGKPVRKMPLPRLADTHLSQICILGGVEERLPEEVRQAKARVRHRLEELAASVPNAASAASETHAAEAAVLNATRRAIYKARPDEEGFVAARGRGVVPLKIAPPSIERGLQVLSRFLVLAETQGFRPQVADNGLDLVVDGESVAFGLEERPGKGPHAPTAVELKRRDENHRLGNSSTPWQKHDNAPSGRLAIFIRANSYSGLRRTYSDRKARALEDILPTVLAGFAEHAALIKEQRRADEERERQWREAEARRSRAEAFKAREQQRLAFADAIHEQLAQRAKLTAVLSHLESATGDEARRLGPMLAWVRRRLHQMDALISPLFLDISATFAKIDFEDPPADDEIEGSGGYFSYSPSVELQLWSIDEEKGLATSRTDLQWAVEAGLVPDLKAESADVPGDKQ